MSAPQQDQDVAVAYKRLATSLAGPPDLLARVEGRMRARRRKRVAGAAALAMVGIAGVTLVGLSGEEDTSSRLAVDRPEASQALTITLENGSPYTFEDVALSCRMYQGRQLIEAENAPRFDGDTLVDPLLTFSAALDEIDTGIVLDVPDRTAVGQDGRRTDGSPHATLFFSLPGTSNNELSSSEDGGSGTIEVLSASCGSTPHLQLQVDAVLGSEVSQDPRRIVGYLDE